MTISSSLVRRSAAARLVVLFAAAACAGDPASRPGAATVRDSAGIRIVESPAPAAPDSVFAEVGAAPLLSIGSQEGDANYQFHRVSDAYRFADGRTAVANSGTHEIRYYDPDGKFARSVGRRGAGPGEFAAFVSIRLHAHHDTLLASDDLRLHVYAPDGRFVETRPFDVTGEFTRPFMEGVFADGSLLAMAFDGGGSIGGPPGSFPEPSPFSLLRYDARGRRANDIARATDRPRFVHEYGRSISYPYIPFTAAALHGNSGDEVFLVRGARPELEVYSPSGQLTRIVRWNRPTPKVADIWSTERPRMLAAMSAQQRPRYEDLYNQKLPLPEFVPAYVAMQVDSERRVWLQRYRLASDTAPPTWDIIDPAGTWLGHAIMPRGVTPYRIGDTFLLGKHTDSLGVERVELRALRRR